MDSEFKLYIYPDKPNFQADLTVLETLLKKIKLSGQKLSNNQYATGENFLSLLTFMGCSPNIELEPHNDKPFCSIEIGSVQRPQFISGKNTKYPNCPHCKAKLKSQTCPSCNKSIDPLREPLKFNWRKSAFVASCWIIVGNIYELEAIPNDFLLTTLEQETGVQWKYAYIRQTRINLEKP